MTLTIKDPPELNAPDKSGSSPLHSEHKPGEFPRSNPVCLEVLVTVRTLPGQNGDPSEGVGPSRQEGRTVIVFDNGAVLRLPNNLASGLTVILSNAQGRDVVCKIVHGRNLPTVKGYVEVEFMEPVNDFWQIRQDPDSSAPSPTVTQGLAFPLPLSGADTPASSSAPVARSSAKDGTAASGRGPTFEDIAGLVNMTPANASREKTFDSGSPSDGVKVTREASRPTAEVTKSASVAGAPVSSDASEKSAIPQTARSSSLAVQKPASTNDFVAKGMLGSGSLPDSSQAAPRGRMQLIIGGAVLVLAGFGSGYFFMHRGSAPLPAAAEVVASQPTSPSAPASTSASTPTQTLPPVLDPVPAQSQTVSASSTRISEDLSASSEPQNPRRTAESVPSRQPDPVEAKRPAIPNLKMKIPSAPSQNLGKFSAESAPGVTDVTSSAALGATPIGSMLAPVARTEKQPAPPVALNSFEPSRRASIREPKLISSIQPTYPSMAKQTRTEGSVLVSAEIDARGNVARVTATTGPMLLRQAAMEAVKQWKYSPQLVDGRPTSTTVTISLDFRLK